jgi:hypothetical protein
MPPRSRHAPMEAHLDACSLEAGRRSPNRADTRPRLGLVAGDLTNPRPAGHTVVTLEAQLLGSRFCVGRHSNIDEISHLGSPRLECCQQARDPNAPTAMPPVTGVIAPSDNISRQWRKDPFESVRRFVKSVASRSVSARPRDRPFRTQYPFQTERASGS